MFKQEALGVAQDVNAPRNFDESRRASEQFDDGYVFI
jgi:hypothetical protein